MGMPKPATSLNAETTSAASTNTSAGHCTHMVDCSLAARTNAFAVVHFSTNNGTQQIIQHAAAFCPIVKVRPSEAVANIY